MARHPSIWAFLSQKGPCPVWTQHLIYHVRYHVLCYHLKLHRFTQSIVLGGPRILKVADQFMDSRVSVGTGSLSPPSAPQMAAKDTKAMSWTPSPTQKPSVHSSKVSGNALWRPHPHPRPTSPSACWSPSLFQTQATLGAGRDRGAPLKSLKTRRGCVCLGRWCSSCGRGQLTPGSSDERQRAHRCG